MRNGLWNALHFVNELVSLLGWATQLYAGLECGGVIDLRRLGASPMRLSRLLLAASCVLLLFALRAARGVRHCVTRPASPTPAGCQSLAIIYLLCCAASAYLSPCTDPLPLAATTATLTPTSTPTALRWSLCSTETRETLYWALTLLAIFVVIEQFSDPRLVTCSTGVSCSPWPARVDQVPIDAVPMIERRGDGAFRRQSDDLAYTESIDDVSDADSAYVTLDF